MQATSTSTSAASSSGEEEEEPSFSSSSSTLNGHSDAEDSRPNPPPPLVEDDDSPGQPKESEATDLSKQQQRKAADGDAPNNLELQWFREQWRKELGSQATESGETSSSSSAEPGSSGAGSSSSSSVANSAKPRLARFLEKGKGRERMPFAMAEGEQLAFHPATANGEVPLMHISTIPDEVLVYIFSFTDPQTVGRLSFSSKKMYALTREPAIWRIMCHNIFGAKRCKRSVCQKYRGWRHMFLTRPRIRFDGLFVSRNKYLRPGSTEWTYNQPVHEVIYYRYLRFLEDGVVLYNMALEEPRKVLRWFHPRNLAGVDAHQSFSSRNAGIVAGANNNYPLRGTYQMDDVAGQLHLWVQGKGGSTQEFELKVQIKQAGRYIALGLTEYTSKSRQGTTTTYPSNTVAPFHFLKVAPDLLDPPPAGSTPAVEAH